MILGNGATIQCLQDLYDITKDCASPDDLGKALLKLYKKFASLLQIGCPLFKKSHFVLPNSNLRMGTFRCTWWVIFACRLTPVIYI